MAVCQSANAAAIAATETAAAALCVLCSSGQPVVRQLLLDALRWWVTEYQVDGFCFVNAENLTQVRHTDREHNTQAAGWLGNDCRLLLQVLL